MTLSGSGGLYQAVRRKNCAFAALATADIFCAKWQAKRKRPGLPVAWTARREELADAYEAALADFYRLLDGRGKREC